MSRREKRAGNIRKKEREDGGKKRSHLQPWITSQGPDILYCWVSSCETRGGDPGGFAAHSDSEHTDSGTIKRKQWAQARRPSQTLQVRFSEPRPLELEGTLKAILLGVSSVGA